MKYSVILATTFAATAFARAVPQDTQDPSVTTLTPTEQEEQKEGAVSGLEEKITLPEHSNSKPEHSNSKPEHSNSKPEHSNSKPEHSKPEHSKPEHSKPEDKYPVDNHKNDYDDKSNHKNDYDDKSKHNDYDDKSKHNDYDDKSKHNDYDSGYSSGGKKDDGAYSSDYDNSRDYDDDSYKKEVSKYDEVYFKPTEKQCYEDKKKTPGYKTYKPEPKDYNEERSCYGNFKWPANIHKQKSCEIEWSPKHYSGKWEKKDNTKIYLYDCDDYSKPYKVVCDKDCGHGKYKWTVPDDCETSDSKKPKFYRFKFVREDDEEDCTWGEEIPIYAPTYIVKPAKPEECPEPVKVPECPPVPVAPVKQVESKPSQPPTYGSSPVNNTTPVTDVYTGAGSAARASFSVILGVAALVTFAL